MTRVLVTGATGLIGSAVCDALLERGDQVVGLSRDAEAAGAARGDVSWHSWKPATEPAPPEALAGCDGVVNLLGERIDQRWNDTVKRRLYDSRVLGTHNLVAGIRAAEPRPRVLVSGSAVGYYGDRGAEELDEGVSPGDDFLARLTVDWEAEARAAEQAGLRVVLARTGQVLSRDGGLLARMLLPFRLGLGGPIAGGRQYMPWVHIADEVGIILWALDGEVSGPLNLSAPEPVTNRQFTKALGGALRRPAVVPVPGLALRLVLGELASYADDSQRVVPARALEGGYRFRQPDLGAALRDLLD